MMNLRLKLRKTQSTVPTEKLQENLTSLEIIGETIQKIPPLDHLKLCQFLLINAPEVREISSLPENLKILKLRGLRALPQSLPKKLNSLSLSHLEVALPQDLQIPDEVETLDLSGNSLESLPPSLFKLKKLKRLNLDKNNLKEIPSELFSLSTLNHLSLDGNPLSELSKDNLYKAFGIWF